METLSPIQETHVQLARDYIEKLEGLDDWDTQVETVKRKNLIAFCQLTIDRILNWELPDDKMWRWVWFVQWSLITLWIVETEEERDRTRPMFHKAYAESWITPPKTKHI